MAVSVPLWLLTTILTLICCAAAYALGRSTKGSPFTRAKRPPVAPTSESQSALAQLQADQVALYSTLEKLCTTVKRLSSRQGMRDSRDQSTAPPIGASKVELRRFYGVSGMSPTQQAQHQLELERNPRTN